MSVAPLLLRALRDGGIFAAIVAVVGSVVGVLADGSRGLSGALLGSALSALFLGLTAVSMLIAARVTRDDPGSPVYFAIVLAGWFVKLLVFMGFGLWLRTQDWLNPVTFAVTVIIVVMGSLMLDALALQRSRVPYVSDIALPGEEPASRPTPKP